MQITKYKYYVNQNAKIKFLILALVKNEKIKVENFGVFCVKNGFKLSLRGVLHRSNP